VIVMVAPPADRSLVPPAMRKLVRDLGRGPRGARLAGHPAWQYSALRARKSARAFDVTVLPSTAGVLGIACASTGWSYDASTDCASSILSVSMGGARILAPAGDLALRLRLPRVLATLDQARVRRRTALRRAATAARQARLARDLARDHVAAVDSLRPVAGRAGASLVDRLSDAADAYLALARAANLGSASRFDAARGDVRSAEARLR